MGYVSDIAERAKKSHRKEGKGESSASAAERERSLPGYSVLSTAVCEVHYSSIKNDHKNLN